jgi:hypothetical protein
MQLQDQCKFRISIRQQRFLGLCPAVESTGVKIMSVQSILAFGLAPALMIGTTGLARANETSHDVPQMAGIITDLGSRASAHTYWVDEADGIHVVTTVDSIVPGPAAGETEQHAIVRFSALILPGQSQLISLPGPVGKPQQALRIRRLGNRSGDYRIEVERVPAPDLTASANRSGRATD